MTGQKVQTCKKLQRLSSYNDIRTAVYDFDARSQSWNKIELVCYIIKISNHFK